MDQDKKTVFISYGRDEKNPQDVELVRRVKQDLEKEGFAILIDEEQLRTANDWEVKLEEMILQADWILFFITPYSARRPEGYCLNELAMALSYKKPIAPVMVNYMVPPLSICRVQYLDLQVLKHDDDYQKKLKEIVGVINEDHRLGFEGEHLSVLTELNPIKFETTIAKHIYGFTGREWVYDAVDRWLKEEDDSRVLWILAEAGFGKSATAIYLAKTHPSAMSVYFCQYDYIESKDPKEMLKVLIYELSTQMDEYKKVLQTLDIKETLQKSAEHIFTQLLLEPLQQTSKPDKKYFFIIDALDEADENGSNEIVELIGNRFLDLPSWLSIIITSRPEPELIRKLKKFTTIELKADEERNRSDLEQYLSKNKKIIDEGLIKALIKKCEGNMLYLKSIFELEIIKNGELTLESIEKLPDTMEDFYLKYFERRFEDVDQYEERYLEFVSVLVEEEGMSELLLKDILKLSEREYKRTKSSFGSLLEVNGENLTFYHKTIYDWLSDYDMSGDYSADIELGGDKYQRFMDSLTPKSYKAEYMMFEHFNRDLIDKTYDKNDNLDRFFDNVKNIDDELKVSELLILGTFYTEHNMIDKAILLQEGLLSIIEQHGTNKKWLNFNVIVLRALARAYDKLNDRRAIKLKIKALSLLRKHKDDSEEWSRHYINILESLAYTYDSEDEFDKASEYKDKAYELVKRLYLEKDRDLWAEEYIKALQAKAYTFEYQEAVSLVDIEAAIDLKETVKKVLEKYKDTNYGMNRRYIKNLLSLASSYDHRADKLHKKLKKFGKKTGKSKTNSVRDNLLNEKVIMSEKGSEKLKLKAYDTIMPLFEKDRDAWLEEYISCRNAMAVSFDKRMKYEDALGIKQMSRNVLEPYFESVPERWGNLFVKILKGVAFTYDNMPNNLDDAREVKEEILEVLEKLYYLNKKKFVSNYIRGLDTTRYTYKGLNDTENINEVEQKIDEIINDQYELKYDNWGKSYLIYLSHKYNQKVPIEIELETTKKLYGLNEKKWKKRYIHSLKKYLVDTIDMSQQQTNDIYFKILNIQLKYYFETPKEWAYNLAMFFKKVALYGDNDERIKITELGEYGVIAVDEYCFHEPTASKEKLYLRYLNNLSFLYLRLAQVDLDRSKKYSQEAFEIIKLKDYRSDEWLGYHSSCIENLLEIYKQQNNTVEALRLINGRYLTKRVFDELEDTMQSYILELRKDVLEIIT